MRWTASPREGPVQQTVTTGRATGAHVKRRPRLTPEFSPKLQDGREAALSQRSPFAAEAAPTSGWRLPGATGTRPLEPASQGKGPSAPSLRAWEQTRPLLRSETRSPACPSQPGSETSSVAKATSTSGAHGVRTAGPRGATSSKGFQLPAGATEHPGLLRRGSSLCTAPAGWSPRGTGPAQRWPQAPRKGSSWQPVSKAPAKARLPRGRLLQAQRAPRIRVRPHSGRGGLHMSPSTASSSPGRKQRPESKRHSSEAMWKLGPGRSGKQGSLFPCLFPVPRQKVRGVCKGRQSPWTAAARPDGQHEHQRRLLVDPEASCPRPRCRQGGIWGSSLWLVDG